MTEPMHWRDHAKARKKAQEFFDAMKTADRWAYWADECSLRDIFDCDIPREVRREIIEMVNFWVADPGDPGGYEGGIGS